MEVESDGSQHGTLMHTLNSFQKQPLYTHPETSSQNLPHILLARCKLGGDLETIYDIFCGHERILVGEVEAVLLSPQMSKYLKIRVYVYALNQYLYIHTHKDSCDSCLGTLGTAGVLLRYLDRWTFVSVLSDLLNESMP